MHTSPVPQQLPYVWELNCDGVVSQAVGTMHITRDVFSEDILRRIQGMKNIIVEVFDPTPTKIQDPFTKSEIDLLASAIGIPTDLVAAVPLSERSRFLLFYPDHQDYCCVDDVICDLARELELPIIGLERIEDQMTNAATKQGVELLREAIRAERREAGFVADLVLALKKQFLTAIRDYEQGTLDLQPELDEEEYSKTITERNLSMVERSLPYLTQPSLVAVGYAHFVHEPSLLTLYRQRGIKVRRL